MPIAVEDLRPVMRDVALFDKLMLVRTIATEVKEFGWRHYRAIIPVEAFACDVTFRVRLGTQWRGSPR